MTQSTVRSRTFCCCVPVRLGVFVLTILGMLGGTTLAVLGWYESASLKGGLSRLNEISLYIFSAVYTILAIMSVFGFIGAIRRQRTFVSIFFSMLVAHLTFNIFSGAFMLYNLFNQEGQAAVDHCIQGSGQDAGLSAADCKHGIDVIKGIAVGVLIAIWLLEIWGCFIVNSYVSQLDDESYANWPKVGSDIEDNQVAGPRPL